MVRETGPSARSPSHKLQTQRADEADRAEKEFSVVSNVPREAGSQPRKRRLLVVVIAIVVVAAAVTVVWLFTRSDDKPAAAPPGSTSTRTRASSPPAKAGRVKSFSGHGNDVTKAFNVAANWEVRWRTGTRKAFAIELLGKGDESRGQIVLAKKKSTGSTFVSEAGHFKLKITAAGNWSVKVFSRPSE
jgi:hypothetical protein